MSRAKPAFISSLLLLLSCLNLISQTDFRNGYIITNNNDTLYGLIDYKGNKANALKCIFRASPESEIQEFNPHDLKAYRFTDSKYYVSDSLKIGESYSLLFLEYLIDGIVDIYYYRDVLGEHYLIDNGDGEIHELKNEEREIIRNNTTYLFESREYIGVLKYSFSKSPEMAQKAEAVELNHKSLIKVTHDYNTGICPDSACIIFEKKLPKTMIYFGPVIGVNLLVISVYDEIPDELYYLRESDFGNTIYPSAGLFIKINMPYINERLFLQYEASYSRYTLETFTWIFDPYVHLSYLNDIKLTQQVLNNTGVIRYELRGKKIRASFHAGFFYNYSLQADYTRELVVKYSATGEIYYTRTFYENPFSKSDFGFNLGAGLAVNIFKTQAFNIDFRYQRGVGFSDYMGTNYFQLNLGLEFGK